MVRLLITGTTTKHGSIASSLSWNSSELYSCGEDGVVWKWDKNHSATGTVGERLTTSYTQIAFLPKSRASTTTSASDADSVFAVGCTDGSFRIVHKTGRLEKHVPNAHTGAVTCVVWCADASLLTAGEDGNLRVWSRKGLPRATLLQTGKCIYSIVWSPNGDQVLIASGNNLIIKPMQPSQTHLQQWNAHGGIILKADWNPVNNLIISASEDCRYRVWDPYGKMLYNSNPWDQPITCVSWSPNGDMFAVGSFNSVALCDKAGWIYSRDTILTGSLFEIAWTSDGTQFAAGGANGAVCFASLVDRRVESGGYVVVIDENQCVRVLDKDGILVEELGKREIVKMAMAYNHLVLCTSSSCIVYNTSKWTNPTQIDLKDNVTFVLLSSKYLAVNDSSGVHVYTYDARHVLTPRLPGLRPEFINTDSLSLTDAYIALVDRANPRTISIFDLSSGRALPAPLVHTVDILQIQLSPKSDLNDQHTIAVIDKNNDLFISPVSTRSFHKVVSMVDSVLWHDSCNMLAAIADGKFIVWYYPQTVFVDPEFLPKTAIIREAAAEFGGSAHLVSFTEYLCAARRPDGSLVHTGTGPLGPTLHNLVQQREWGQCLRLCRHVKEPHLWAAVSAMAISAKELDTAEIALAAIEEVDKLRHIKYINHLPAPLEIRNAMLHDYRHAPLEAERILLQSGAFYRAIKMHIHAYRWERALDIAVKNNTHVDTVLAYRQRYLEEWGKTETNKKFAAYSQIPVSWEKIKLKIKKEKEEENRRFQQQQQHTQRS
ncbi:intraflagellar transport protein 80-like [Pelomyxa schiedti]|nr:intraflagellar transport protein 80-like [Pelomyxa schiedti]